MSQSTSPATTSAGEKNPWLALIALCLGFFMILVDTTIVAVAQPDIQEKLHTDISNVVWVTSAYLLAYAVPLLVTGRLGDRFGARNLYIIGLVVFTAASLWCGLAGSITTLIVARVVQGIGASLINPQTLAVITRIFPPDKRGTAMGAWGAVAGVATLVGPLLGGVLVDSLGWEWIFFVNIPFGFIAIVLALRWVPALPSVSHKFDWIGVALSGIGLFLLIFGIQEGESHNWDGAIWACIVGGLVVLVIFVGWQRVMKGEPLVPLSLFGDRNFSMSSIGIASIALAINAMFIPVMYYLQKVAALSATEAALVTVPNAIATGVLAPVIGRRLNSVHPRTIVATGLLLSAVSIAWFALICTPDRAIWQLLLPMALMGAAGACVWAPLAATATRNLPAKFAGAGSGVYNTNRMIGAVLGAALIAAMLSNRIAAHLPAQALAHGMDDPGPIPGPFREGFSTAMAQSLWLPAIALAIGAVATLFLERPKEPHPPAPPQPGRSDVLASAD